MILGGRLTRGSSLPLLAVRGKVERPLEVATSRSTSAQIITTPITED
jgi:hypothetical protein